MTVIFSVLDDQGQLHPLLQGNLERVPSVGERVVTYGKNEANEASAPVPTGDWAVVNVMLHLVEPEPGYVVWLRPIEAIVAEQQERATKQNLRLLVPPGVRQ